ncbi:homoserine O-acetyltransferase MetX [Ruania rhizosphaerae]|uniref:homoserine O-acetyltransferase MetX n=1 Tax=Ruania rhizosphaerae TaxID=1840413 RepID=UPI00190F938C
MPGAPARRSPGRRRAPQTPIPASGAWRDGDPAGERQFADLGPLHLEAGGRLPHVRLAYQTWGELNAAGDNAILVLHALTGDAHVTGETGPGHRSPGWWSSTVGPGKTIDTDRFFVVAPNVLGGCQGSTGPASDAPNGTPWGSRFPYVTVRDQVAAEVELADRLGIGRWKLVIGASMGGHRVLEWGLIAPERVAALAAIATCAQTSADQIAWAHAQIGAIRADPRYRGGDYYDAADGDGPHTGLGIARQIAHTTYRSAEELDERFGRLPQGGENPLGGGGRFAVQSYLDHHADKLARRFDANSYVVLTESMLTHDIGRDRGGVEAALATLDMPTLALAVRSDRLFPPSQSERIARGAPRGFYRELDSPFGHDGFLIEDDQLTPILSELLTAR